MVVLNMPYSQLCAEVYIYTRLVKVQHIKPVCKIYVHNLYFLRTIFSTKNVRISLDTKKSASTLTQIEFQKLF